MVNNQSNYNKLQTVETWFNSLKKYKGILHLQKFPMFSGSVSGKMLPYALREKFFTFKENKSGGFMRTKYNTNYINKTNNDTTFNGRIGELFACLLMTNSNGEYMFTDIETDERRKFMETKEFVTWWKANFMSTNKDKTEKIKKLIEQVKQNYISAEEQQDFREMFININGIVSGAVHKSKLKPLNGNTGPGTRTIGPASETTETNSGASITVNILNTNLNAYRTNITNQNKFNTLKANLMKYYTNKGKKVSISNEKLKNKIKQNGFKFVSANINKNNFINSIKNTSN